MEMFLSAGGLKMVHVPYQGGGPSFNALLSGQVPVVPTLESTAKGRVSRAPT
jgi:tripartite-type tricarboxylate transporter receptor subunit TctC